MEQETQRVFDNFYRGIAHAFVVGDAFSLFMFRSVTQHVAITVAFFELHLVLCECASLVREYELYLAQFLNQIRVLAHGKLHIFWEEHLNVCVDQLGLHELQ